MQTCTKANIERFFSPQGDLYQTPQTTILPLSQFNEGVERPRGYYAREGVSSDPGGFNIRNILCMTFGKAF